MLPASALLIPHAVRPIGSLREALLSVASYLRQCGNGFVEAMHLAEPKVPEAPLLTLSGQPDLKIYDHLLTVSLAAVEVCG